VRSQSFLIHQHRVIAEALNLEKFSGPDLCTFPNFVLENLASGRCSLIVPPKWRRKDLREFDSFLKEHQPVTLTCGPAFLRILTESNLFSSLKSINFGGALADCNLIEQAITRWPEAVLTHVYGSSEAEPVSLSEARISLANSRQKGLFQMLHVGAPIKAIQARLEPDHLWVAGPHVSPFYLGDEEANLRQKRKDEMGVIWHDMGDRVQAAEEGWWYAGRSNQPLQEFNLEQRIYSFLQSSSSFVFREKNGKTFLCGEGIKSRKKELLGQFPEIDNLLEIKIFRDRRHRARIDRLTSLKRGAKWIGG
jgi:hypothetical protein